MTSFWSPSLTRTEQHTITRFPCSRTILLSGQFAQRAESQHTGKLLLRVGRFGVELLRVRLRDGDLLAPGKAWPGFLLLLAEHRLESEFACRRPFRHGGSGGIEEVGVLDEGEQPLEVGLLVIANEQMIVALSTAQVLAEEQPAAYKDVDHVVDVVDKVGISKKVARLRPIGVIKG